MTGDTASAGRDLEILERELGLAWRVVLAAKRKLERSRPGYRTAAEAHLYFSAALDDYIQQLLARELVKDRRRAAQLGLPALPDHPPLGLRALHMPQSLQESRELLAAAYLEYERCRSQMTHHHRVARAVWQTRLQQWQTLVVRQKEPRTETAAAPVSPPSDATIQEDLFGDDSAEW